MNRGLGGKGKNKKYQNGIEVWVERGKNKKYQNGIEVWDYPQILAAAEKSKKFKKIRKE